MISSLMETALRVRSHDNGESSVLLKNGIRQADYRDLRESGTTMLPNVCPVSASTRTVLNESFCDRGAGL